jgi:hypothetical protein
MELNTMSDTFDTTAVAHFAGLDTTNSFLRLTPQALCCHPLRGLRDIIEFASASTDESMGYFHSSAFAK